MDRATRRLFTVLLVVMLAVGGGAALLFGASGVPDPDLPPGTSTVTGVIVGVEAKSLGDVRSFRLRTIDGTVLEFDLAELDNWVEFPPGHLAEHQVTAEPVRVAYREAGGRLLAIRLADAGT